MMRAIMVAGVLVLSAIAGLYAQGKGKGPHTPPATHGKKVSTVAKETPSGPGKGQVVREVAKEKSKVKVRPLRGRKVGHARQVKLKKAVPAPPKKKKGN